MGRSSQQLTTNGQKLRRRKLRKQKPRSPQRAVCGQRRTKLNKTRPSRQSRAATGETGNRERPAIVPVAVQTWNRELASSRNRPALPGTERIVRRWTPLRHHRKGTLRLLPLGVRRNRRQPRPARAAVLPDSLAHNLAVRVANPAAAGIRSATRARRDSVMVRPRSIWWS